MRLPCRPSAGQLPQPADLSARKPVHARVVAGGPPDKTVLSTPVGRASPRVAAKRRMARMGPGNHRLASLRSGMPTKPTSEGVDAGEGPVLLGRTRRPSADQAPTRAVTGRLICGARAANSVIRPASGGETARGLPGQCRGEPMEATKRGAGVSLRLNSGRVLDRLRPTAGSNSRESGVPQDRDEGEA